MDANRSDLIAHFRELSDEELISRCGSRTLNDIAQSIAIEELHAHGQAAAADFVAEVIVVTVGLSVLLHGLTAGVIAARWPADRTNL
jgi:hypothetical protein